MRSPSPRSLLAAFVCSLSLALSPVAQTPGNGARIEWQRSLDDALAVQKATGLPLLIVVNMNGEVFNDRFATVTYLDPAFVESTRGYVCLVCSPDRHNERDYDAEGNRIECPRFPGCTCSEHNNVEPLVYERWFNGKRNAPRHVGVSPDGKVMFDRYLDQSMATAIEAIAKHRGTPKNTPLPTNVNELFTRCDAAARHALEQQFRSGDVATKKALLTAAAKATNRPFDLLRMALRSDDDTIFSLAATALAAVATKEALIDVEDALARADDTTVRSALIACLQKMDDPMAQRLGKHAAPVTPPAPPGPWNAPWRTPSFDANDRASIEAELDRCEAALKATPDDSTMRLRLATAQAAFATLLIRDGGKGIEFWLEDAVRSARKVTATELRTEVEGLLSFVYHMQGDDVAAAQAITAASHAPRPAHPIEPWLATRALATGVVIDARTVFANGDSAKSRDLRAEVERTVLALTLAASRNAMLGEDDWLAASGLLEIAGLRHDARGCLVQALASLPGSQRLHERWRARLLVDLGAEAMRRSYAKFVDGTQDKATAEWFAGYAALVAAEQHTRDARSPLAIAAYGDAIERFTKSKTGGADFEDTANHFLVLALAGRAPLRLAKGEAEGAVDDLVRAAALRAASLDDDDGLQRKPRAIASRIQRELEQQGKTELAAKLKPLLN